jgi:hypothetical protein
MFIKKSAMPHGEPANPAPWTKSVMHSSYTAPVKPGQKLSLSSANFRLIQLAQTGSFTLRSNIPSLTGANDRRGQRRQHQPLTFGTGCRSERRLPLDGRVVQFRRH